MVIALALVSVGASGCFKVSSDAGALRDSVIKSSAAEWDQEIEIGVGAIALTLARTGLAFVDLEPEARAALRAVRSAEVGVYKRRGGHKPLKNTAILRAADRVMNDRGWERIIGVMNRRELVAIYVRGDVRSTRNVKVCLVTVNDHELVVASARSNLEPLMAVAFNRAERPKGPFPLPFNAPLPSGE